MIKIKEKFCMIADKIKIYKNYDNFDYKCPACNKKTHLIIECPKINYIPDQQFLLNKLNYFKFQERGKNPYIRCKKRYNALLKLENTKYKAEKFFLKSLPEICSMDGSLDGRESQSMSSEKILIKNKNIPYEIVSDQEEEKTDIVNLYSGIKIYF